MPSAADSWKVVQRAEALGFTHGWFYDTQMLCADCFVAMASASVKTSRIRLGTGVLIPSNRIAPVTANALASLNALAPGRIDFGIGTGFTGRRAMGLGAMSLPTWRNMSAWSWPCSMRRPEFAVEGQRQRICFLNPEMGFINTRDPLRLHVSAYGPKLCALTQAGPRAAVLLRRAADQALSGLPNTSAVPETVAHEVAGYIGQARGYEPADARYLQNHRGHLLFVRPDERRFITAEVIRRTTFTGPSVLLLEQLAALRDAGYTQFAIQVLPGQEAAIEDWARLMRAFAGS